jgi:hypothetical protein
MGHFMKTPTNLSDLEHFVQRRRAIVFCSATWVSWIPAYRKELDQAGLPIIEIDVDDPVFLTLLQANSVFTVPSFLLYCDGSLETVRGGRTSVNELRAWHDKPDRPDHRHP